MKNKIITGTIGIYFVKNLAGKTTLQKENNNRSIKIVNVDRVISAPDHYKGFLGVGGSAIKIDEDKSIFLLGCEDACIIMPVEYKGQMPEPGSEIVVYGELRKNEDDRYVFEGKEVKTK